VARFATDLFRIKAQIVCKFYPPELIVEMSGVMNTPEGQNPQLLQAAVQMLSNSTIRDFHIQVEADTLAQIDEQADKQNANEAVLAIGQFLGQALPMVQQAPEMLPMMSEMLLFLVRRYRAGRSLESAIEQAMKALQAKAQQALAQPPQNPEMMKMQAEQQAEQMRMQAQAQSDQMKVQAQAQLEQGKAQLEMQMQQAKAQADMQLEQMKEQFAQQIANNELQVKAREMQGKEEYERWKAELDAATKIMVARIGSNPGVDLPVIEAASAQITNELGGTIVQAMDKMAQMHDQMTNLHGQTMQNIGEAIQKLNAPKKVVRGADGLVIGVETV
jgi:F0F1-type ATP synthase membrane subunit b/b'